jgi:hypothetical protein
MGWPNNYVQGVYNALGSLIGLSDGAGGQIGLAATYTWATKPLASAYIGRAFISDVGGGSIWISNGTRWRPEGGRVTLLSLNASVTATFGAEAIFSGTSLLLHAGLFQNYDKLRVTGTLGKSAAVETASQKFKLGTLGTIVDTTLLTQPTNVTGANQSSGFEMEFRRESATSVRKIGNSLTTHQYSGPTAAGVNAAVTVSDLDANATYFHYSNLSSAAVETYTLYDYNVELITGI